MSASDQYTLSGYLAKYFIYAESDPSLVSYFFKNISADINFDDSFKSPRFSKRESIKVSQASQMKFSHNNDRREEVMREFEKVKFIWNLYQLKTTVCPKIRSNGETDKVANSKELAVMSVRLK